MPRHGSKTGRVGDLRRRALIARSCGARMQRSGVTMAQAEAIVALDPQVLTVVEQAARATLLPATWLASWRAGWRAAERGEA